MKNLVKAILVSLKDPRVVVPVAVTAVTAVTLMAVQQRRALRLEIEEECE
jgi:hypothetical protein